ncbi:MAG: bifunctional glutamate N-acetyltransferase/amino-acid acetyltransferase ArgJ [Myxococcaceae bacterium]
MNGPLGFRFAGLHVGIKPGRKDLALVVSDVPASAAGCFTVNRAKAAPVRDAEARLPADGARAVLINSGNANALTGRAGQQDVERLRDELAAVLHVGAQSVYTASTGVIGVRLPLEKISGGLERLVASLGPGWDSAAEAILTTDTHKKVAMRSLQLRGREVRLLGLAKGSGMIAPQMATMIAAVCTDAAVPPPVLAKALRLAVDRSFHCLVVDGDMSTNDVVFALANGLASNPPLAAEGADFEAFAEALAQLCIELAQAIAADGEGATRLLTVEVSGAPDVALARDAAKSIAVSPLVKSAVFGADPNWGRILATVGARAGSQNWPVDPQRAEVRIQEVLVYGRGAPVTHDADALRVRMREPKVLVQVHLAEGAASATAWGCDLSYDYVKINADYTSLIVPGSDGSVSRDDRLTRYSPGFKRALLVEALKYISRFAGSRCVLSLGGGAMVKETLKRSFCEDVNLLRSVGLKPLVVHGGGHEIAATLKQLGAGEAGEVDGVRVTDETDLKLVEMVLTGRVNSELVTLLNSDGGCAVGVSGKDGPLLRARKLVNEGGDLGRVGEVTDVNREFLEMLLAGDYVPVIAPVGLGEGGMGFHMFADAVAAEVAVAVGARKLIILLDAPGLTLDGELQSQLTAADLEHQLADGAVAGYLKVTIQAILRALRGGVERVHVIDARVPHSGIAELFTDHGVGTLVTLL